MRIGYDNVVQPVAALGQFVRTARLLRREIEARLGALIGPLLDRLLVEARRPMTLRRRPLPHKDRCPALQHHMIAQHHRQADFRGPRRTRDSYDSDNHPTTLRNVNSPAPQQPRPYHQPQPAGGAARAAIVRLTLSSAAERK